MPKPRNYDYEYKAYQGKDKQKKNRAKRNAARRKVVAKVGKAKVAGRDVDHKHGVGAGNSMSNLRILTKHANRSYKRTSTGKQKRR